MLKKIMKTDGSVAGLLLRLALGIVMFPHGAQKMLGWFGGGGFSATMEGMTSNGLPAVVVLLVILGEFFGSIGLIVGFLSRIAAGGIAIIMIGAANMHAANGFFMNWYGNQNGEGYEFHLLAIGIALALVLRGSGALSLDHALSKR